MKKIGLFCLYTLLFLSGYAVYDILVSPTEAALSRLFFALIFGAVSTYTTGDRFLKHYLAKKK